MNSRNRAVRALIMSFLVAFGVSPWSAALADLGSKGDRVAFAPPAKFVPLTAIGDDPDVIPTIALATAEPGRLAPPPSRYAAWLQRASGILSVVTGLPSPVWATPLAASTASPAAPGGRSTASPDPGRSRCRP